MACEHLPCLLGLDGRQTTVREMLGSRLAYGFLLYEHLAFANEPYRVHTVCLLDGKATQRINDRKERLPRYKNAR